jgi:hypothetical protein
MARTMLNHYEHSDLDLSPITLNQGHNTSLGPGQQSCEILFKKRELGVMARTNSDGHRADNAIT